MCECQARMGQHVKRIGKTMIADTSLISPSCIVAGVWAGGGGHGLFSTVGRILQAESSPSAGETSSGHMRVWGVSVSVCLCLCLCLCLWDGVF